MRSTRSATTADISSPNSDCAHETTLPQRRYWVVPLLAIVISASIFVICCVVDLANARFEESIARMPLGITAAESVEHVGRAPDARSKQKGVLVGTNQLLAATNSKAAEHGPLQEFTLYIWRHGKRQGTVVIDANDKVAGRWTWRP